MFLWKSKSPDNTNLLETKMLNWNILLKQPVRIWHLIKEKSRVVLAGNQEYIEDVALLSSHKFI